MSVPYWRRTTRLGEIRADVAIIGAGITGIAAALHLERAGHDALVIDRGPIAAGASGRNAGFLMRGAFDNYAAACRDWGRDRARLVWRWTEENLALLRAEGIESIPTVQRVPSVLLALTEHEATELRESARIMREDGFDVALIESGTDAPWCHARPLVGLVNPSDGACNPHHLLAHLAAKISRPPVLHQEVHAIDDAGDAWLVRLADADVRAPRVLIAANAYAPRLMPALDRLVTPRRGQMLALRVDRPMLDASYYANHGSEYFRQPAPDTVVVGGFRTYHADAEVGCDDTVTEPVQRGLEGFARTVLGDEFPITARWSGVMAFTPDGLPIADALDPERRLWFSGGYTGHGMSMAFRTATSVVEAMLGGPATPFPLSRFTAPGGPLR